MIPEVNAALRDLLAPHLPKKAAIDFTLQPEEGRAGGGISLFLYEVCKDSDGHEAAWSDVRDASGTLVARKPPTRRFRLSYLVTAWGSSADQETQLLDAAVSALTQWEDAGLADGPGSPAHPGVLLGMEIAGSGGSGPPWEVLKAARVAARPVFGLIVTTSLVHDQMTDLSPRVEKLDLEARKGVDSEVPSGAAGVASESVEAGSRPHPDGDGLALVKKWQRIRVERPAERG